MSNDQTKILLVEDEPDVCSAIKSYLSRRGCSVVTTASGKEALPIIDISRPDIVLLDLTIEGLNGKEVLSRLRQYDRKTKVIVITGELLNEDEIERIQALGISAYLQKPISLEKLATIIKDVLGRKFDSKIIFREAQRVASKKSSDFERAIHDLKNLLGVIRNKCENFTLDLDDGVYKGKSDKEIIDLAAGTMNTVIKTVDRITATVKKFKRPIQKGGRSKK